MYLIDRNTYNMVWAEILANVISDPECMESILSEKAIKDPEIFNKCKRDATRAGLVLPMFVRIMAGYEEENAHMDLKYLQEVGMHITTVGVIGLPVEVVFPDIDKKPDFVPEVFEKIPAPIWLMYMARFDAAIAEKMEEIKNACTEHS